MLLLCCLMLTGQHRCRGDQDRGREWGVVSNRPPTALATPSNRLSNPFPFHASAPVPDAPRLAHHALCPVPCAPRSCALGRPPGRMGQPRAQAALQGPPALRS